MYATRSTWVNILLNSKHLDPNDITMWMEPDDFLAIAPVVIKLIIFNKNSQFPNILVVQINNFEQ